MLDVVLVVDPSLACPKQCIYLADALYSFCRQNRGVGSCRILGLPGQEKERGEDPYAIWESRTREYGKSLKIVTVNSCTAVLRATCSFVHDTSASPANWSGCVITFVAKERCETITDIASSFGFQCLHYCQDIESHKADEASWDMETRVVEILMWIGCTIKEKHPELHPIGVIASPKRILKMNVFFPLMPPEDSGYTKFFIPIEISLHSHHTNQMLGLESVLIKYSDFIQHIEWHGENPYSISRALGKFLNHRARDVPLLDTFEAMNVLFDRTSMYSLMDDIAFAARRKYALPVRSAKWELVSKRTVNTLSCPYILKSRIACGLPDSHNMALILKQDGLAECELADPVVAQEYINHHGILFKVYVVGKHVMMERRSSMPDIHLRGLENNKVEELPSCIEFDSLHSLPTRLPWLENGSTNHKRTSSSTILTDYFFEQLGTIVREHISLSAFGFDLVFDNEAGEVLLLDINYFPSFGKISEAPSHFIDTFLA